MLKKGQCIVRVNSHDKLFALATQYLSRSWLSDDEIAETNKKILERAKIQNNLGLYGKLLENKKMEGITICQFCGKEIKQTANYCEECLTKLEEDKELEEFNQYINELALKK